MFGTGGRTTRARTDFSIALDVVHDGERTSLALQFADGEFAGFRHVPGHDIPTQWEIDLSLLVDYLVGDLAYFVVLQESRVNMPLQLIYFTMGYFGRCDVQQHFRSSLLAEDAPPATGRIGGRRGELVDHLDAWLAEMVEQGHNATGMQVYASVHGEPILQVARGADGLGRPVLDDSLALVRCALSKPVIALEVASLVGSDRLSYDTAVGDVLDGCSPFVAALTVDELLTHRAGMHDLSATLLAILAPSDRVPAAKCAGPPAGYARDAHVEYADGGGAILLAAMLEAICGRPYDALFGELVDPDGDLADDIVFRPGARDRQRIVVDSWIDGPIPVPYRIEELPEYVAEWSPGWSGYATAWGLGRLYELILAIGRGERSVGALDAAAVAQMHAPRWVPTAMGLGYHQNPLSDFSLSRGFCHGFADYGVPEEHRRTVFGHSGQGAVVGLADATTGLVAAVKFFGQINEIRHIHARGAPLIAGLFEAVAA